MQKLPAGKFHGVPPSNARGDEVYSAFMPADLIALAHFGDEVFASLGASVGPQEYIPRRGAPEGPRAVGYP
jgi:hypothetical protein